MRGKGTAPCRCVGAVIASLLVATFLAPSGASAAQHPFLEIFGSAAQPSFGNPAAVAVDQSTGDVLVADMEDRTLSRYHEDGTPSDFSALTSTNVIDGHAGEADEVPGFEGILSNFGSSKETQVAVDSSGGATDGNIYVTSSANGVIDIFASTGEFIGELDEFNEGPEAEGSSAGLGEACGVAVDSSGNVYVGDFTGLIHKYEPSANPPENSDSSDNFSFSSNCTLAAGAGPTDGFIFPTHYGAEVVKLDSTTGEEKYEVDAGPSQTVSVDPVSGHVYVPNGPGIASKIIELDASGASSATEISATPLASTPQGVAVNGTTGNLYATREGNVNIEVFSPVPPEFPLTIQKAGTGEGTVESTPAGIGCGPLCTEETAEFPAESVVELTATASANSEFNGWGSVAGDPGTCTGATSPCEVMMEEAIELEAEFTLRPVPAVTSIIPTKGPTAGGNQVEITGTGLAEATKVEFGSSVVDAPFTENTGTKIKLNVPAHSAGMVNVIVTTGGGASPNTAADDYTYVATPAVTGLSPNKGPTTGGNQVEITGTGLTEATKVEFGSTVVDAPFTENTGTKIKLNAPAHAVGTINVRVTTLGGTSGNFPADDYTYELPTQTLTVSKSGSGSGTVSSSPAGVNCGFECSHAYAEGTVVTLTAAPAGGSSFAGWSGGGCSGTGSCVVTMNAASGVTATFSANPASPPPENEAQGTPKISPTASFSGGKVALKVSCTGTGPCKGTIVLKVKIKGQKKSVGKASYSIAAGKSKTIKVKITNAQVKEKMKEGKVVKATLSGPGLHGTVKLTP